MLRPVTESPRDGTRVLIFFYSPESLGSYGPDAATVVCGEFGEDRWGFDGCPSSLRYPASNVAGWMPIPDRAAPDLAALALRQTEEIERLRAALVEVVQCLAGQPEYHAQGMGCGLENRSITDRYEAMEHGWERAMERIHDEHIEPAADAARAALASKEATHG